MRKLSLLVCAAVLLWGCRIIPIVGSARTRPAAPRIPLDKATANLRTPAGEELCDGVNGLGFKLLGPLSQLMPQQNICISPTSVLLAVGMTGSGANGQTADCISDALGVKGMNKDVFKGECLNLASLFETAGPKVTLSIANSIWAAPDIQLKPDFVESSRRYFDAEVESVNLANDAGLKTVNAWVNTKTKGKIPSILEQGQQASLILLDAVYFKGPWQFPFDPKSTANGEFHLTSGTSKTVPMMSRTADFSYSRSGSGQLLSIPYESQHLAMLIYLPDEDEPLSNVIASMNPQSWSKGIEAMRSSLVSLKLPKFSVNFTASLKSPLCDAGMAQAFSSGLADFKGISDAPLFISDVLHKTTTDVSEEGTVATGATAVVMGVTSPGPGFEPPKPIEFIADHPFLYAIYDTETKAILFVGLLYVP